MNAEQKLNDVIIDAAMPTWCARAGSSGLSLLRRLDDPVATGPRPSDGLGYCLQIPVWVMYSQQVLQIDPTEILAPAVQVKGVLSVHESGLISIDYNHTDLASLRDKYWDYIQKA